MKFEQDNKVEYEVNLATEIGLNMLKRLSQVEKQTTIKNDALKKWSKLVQPEFEVHRLIKDTITEIKSRSFSKEEALAKDSELKAMEEALINKVILLLNNYRVGQTPNLADIRARI